MFNYFKKYLIFPILAFIILLTSQVYSKDISKNTLAPVSKATNLFLNYDDNTLYFMTFQELKTYLEFKYPHMIDIKEETSLKTHQIGMQRKLTYKIKDEKTPYQEPVIYILYFYPKRIKTDEAKIHEMIIFDPEYGHAVLELYNSMQISA